MERGAFGVVLKDSVPPGDGRETPADPGPPKGIFTWPAARRCFLLAGQSVTILREVVDSVLTYSAAPTPGRGYSCSGGRARRAIVRIESVMIPPMATHGEGFSSFNWTLMPIDLTLHRGRSLPPVRLRSPLAPRPAAHDGEDHDDRRLSLQRRELHQDLRQSTGSH